jgi:hypothetical protein
MRSLTKVNDRAFAADRTQRYKMMLPPNSALKNAESAPRATGLSR